MKKKPFAPYKSFFFVYTIGWLVTCVLIALANALCGPENWTADNTPRGLWRLFYFWVVALIIAIIVVWYYGFR